MAVIRAFIGVRLPGEVEEGLAALMDDMRPLWPERGVRWVKPENIHLTLRFIGDIEVGRIEEVGRGLDGIGCAAFDLNLAASGCFPNERRPAVIWAGVEDQDRQLASLHQETEQLVQKLGWEAEGRDYRPHLTLGRVRQGVKPPKGDWLKHPDKLSFRVEEVELIESALKPGGAEYRTRHRAVLSRRGV